MSFFTLCLRIIALILAWYFGYASRPAIDGWRNRERILPIPRPEGTGHRRPIHPLHRDSLESQLAR